MLLAAIATVCLAMPAHTHVIDPFRAPPCDRCAGNRGMELATSAGTDVRAATNGIVTFAGQVGGRNYVVVRASAETMPLVTVCPTPNGLPTASTRSPTSNLSESPIARNGNGRPTSICRIAKIGRAHV